MYRFLFMLATTEQVKKPKSVEPEEKVPDMVPYFNALMQLCCADETEFNELMRCFNADPVIVIDNAKYVSRSILSLLAKQKRERTWIE